MSQRDSPQPSASPTWDDLCSEAMDLQLAGQLDLAEPLYRAILQAEPTHAAANHCLGMLCVQRQRPGDGLPYLLAALEVRPEVADYWLGYLEALLLAGRAEEATSTLALARQHGLAGAAVAEYAQRLDESVLESALKRGDFTAARALARAMTLHHPQHGRGWKVLGALLWAEGSIDESLAAMQRSIELSPADAETHSNLGLALAKLKRFDEAQTHLQAALRVAPDFAAAHYRLGMTYFMQARLPEAEASLRAGIALKAGYAEGEDELYYSNFLFVVSHNPALGADELFAEHCRFGEQFESRLQGSWPKHGNDRNPQRRLKIGFVSGDLREHAVASFIEPLLARLRSARGLELHAYYNDRREDDVNRRLRGYFRGWNDVCDVPDAALAARIIDDQIDILIDLSGHTAMNRLPVFARKPAPLQASWIGYPGTTGLQAMDYFLADPHFLPPGQFDRHFTEKLVYLPAQTPFQPHATAPAVNALPALAAGCMTFGSFNRPDKINDSTIRCWSHLLHEAPRARMILGGIPLQSQQDRLIALFQAHGIARERLTFHPPYAMAAYLALYHQVDLCLDTTPYNGGTTTMHALWMGVPTLTIAGPTPAARSGAAILGQMGLHEFIAEGGAEFVAKGRYWADHLPALAAVRAGLRSRWQQSAARRPEVIAGALEAALRRMWVRWCADLPVESFQIAGAQGTD